MKLNYKFTPINNASLLLILTGVVGSLSGYSNKYDTITNRVIRHYNHSALVISVPSLIMDNNSFINSLNKLIKELTKGINEEVYAMGTSAGGYQLILNYEKILNLKKALVINPVLSLNTDLLFKSIKKLNNEQLVICIGTEDREYELSKSLLEGSSVKPIYFDKVDHYFTSMLDEYIEIPFKYLLKKK